MTKRIPSSLKKAPILDSVFEIRYAGPQEISAILPGILHAGLPGTKKILPAPPIPLEIITSDPNMQSVPTFSMEWGNHIISGNPYFVAVSHRPPYKSWKVFRDSIAKVHKVLINSTVFSEIKRYSIKYIDFINENHFGISPMNLLDISVNIHNLSITEENLTLQVEFPEEQYMQILKVMTHATVIQHGESSPPQRGLIIDTDTICSLDKPLTPQQFLETHTSLLDAIHAKNKTLFFNTLSSEGINCLEPEYD